VEGPGNSGEGSALAPSGNGGERTAAALSESSGEGGAVAPLGSGGERGATESHGSGGGRNAGGQSATGNDPSAAESTVPTGVGIRGVVGKRGNGDTLRAGDQLRNGGRPEAADEARIAKLRAQGSRADKLRADKLRAEGSRADKLRVDKPGADRPRNGERKPRGGDKYVPADFGTPPYAPDGPVPRLYAPDRQERRRGPLAVGLTVTLAVLVVAGAAVTGINLHLRALQTRATEPPPVKPQVSSRTPGRRALTHADFGDRELAGVPDARKVGGWDHATCGPLDGKGKVLAAHGCEQAAQVAYRAAGGGLRAVQLLLAFPSDSRAKDAAFSLSKRSSSALRWRRGGTHEKYGYGKVGVGGVGPYVVVTVVTATGPAVRQGPAFHKVLHTDTLSRFAGLHAG
jgi:hypothetical protein